MNFLIQVENQENYRILNINNNVRVYLNPSIRQDIDVPDVIHGIDGIPFVDEAVAKET